MLRSIPMPKQHGPSSLLFPRSASHTFIGDAFSSTYVYQMIIAQTTRDTSVRSLLSKMKEVYTFLTEADLQHIESMKKIVEGIFRQTLECSYFIREYAKNEKFRKLT